MDIKKLEKIVVPKIWLRGYFSLPIKKTTPVFIPNPKNTKSKLGNNVATE
jgi:hypothetical protein